MKSLFCIFVDFCLIFFNKKSQRFNLFKYKKKLCHISVFLRIKVHFFHWILSKNSCFWTNFDFLIIIFIVLCFQWFLIIFSLSLWWILLIEHFICPYRVFSNFQVKFINLQFTHLQHLFLYFSFIKFVHVVLCAICHVFSCHIKKNLYCVCLTLHE